MSQDAVTMRVYQQKTGVRADKLEWLVHQLCQVMSLNCVGDALSHRGKCEGRLGVSRSPCLVAFNSGVAVLVWTMASRSCRSSIQYKDRLSTSLM